jgi:hypothetical protein
MTSGPLIALSYLRMLPFTNTQHEEWSGAMIYLIGMGMWLVMATRLGVAVGTAMGKAAT